MSMNKIRLLFLCVVVFVFICGLLVFNQLQSPQDPRLGKSSPFFISRVSGNGVVYTSGKPIKAGNMSEAAAADLKRTDYPSEFYIKTDDHSGVEFYVKGTRFIAFPGTYLKYRATGGKIVLFNGSLEWSREFEKDPAVITLTKSANNLVLSKSGRVTYGENRLEVRDYSGKLELSYGDNKIKMSDNQLFVTGTKLRPQTTRVLPRPAWINPEHKVYPLKEPKDSVATIKWKEVRGADNYRFRVFPSPLRESIIFERTVDINRIVIDLLAFEEREVYWQVIPLAGENQVAGTPSPVGHLEVIDGLLETKDVQKKPELDVSHTPPSGNSVFVRGTCEKENAVYVNGELVKRNMDGSFMHPLSYDSIGLKTIIVRAVSPTGVETVKTLNVRIWDDR